MITDQSLPQGDEPSQTHAAATAGSVVTGVEQQARALIRQRPVVAVLTAIGVGYLVARVAARVTR